MFGATGVIPGRIAAEWKGIHGFRLSMDPLPGDLAVVAGDDTGGL
jgi:hypothetical protein